MQKNSENFSMQDAIRMAQSKEGQQLLALLRASDPDIMNDAVNQAASGNYDQAKRTLSAFLSSPDVKALLEKMGRNTHE